MRRSLIKCPTCAQQKGKQLTIASLTLGLGTEQKNRQREDGKFLNLLEDADLKKKLYN